MILRQLYGSFKKNNFVNPIKHFFNGQDALDYLEKSRTGEEEKPGIILLDLNMPGIDGRYILNYLQKNIEFYQIPVIILTTSSDEKDINKCYELGASTYIQKPVTLNGLTQAIGVMTNYWFGIAILPKKPDS